MSSAYSAVRTGCEEDKRPEKPTQSSDRTRFEPSGFDHPQSDFGTSNLAHDGGEWSPSQDLIEIATVVVVTSEYPISEFSLEDIPEELWKWELGGIEDPLGQAINWLWSQFSEAISWLWTNFQNYMNTIRDQLKGYIGPLIDSVLDKFPWLKSFIDLIRSRLEAFYSYVAGAVSTIQSALSTISANVMAFIAYVKAELPAIREFLLSRFAQFQEFISGIVTQIVEIRDFLITKLTELGTTLVNYTTALVDFFQNTVWPQMLEFWRSASASLTQIYTYLSSFGERLFFILKDSFDMMVKYLEQGFVTIAGTLTQIAVGIRSFYEMSVRFWEDVASFIVGTMDAYLKEIGKFIADTQDFFLEAYNRLVSAVKDVHVVLQGFINPLVQIYTFMTNIPEMAVQFVQQQVVPFVYEQALPFFKDVVLGKLIEFGRWVGEAGISAIKKTKEFVEEYAGDFVKIMFSPTIEVLLKFIKWMAPEYLEDFKKYIPEIIMMATIPIFAMRFAVAIITDLAKTEVEILGNKVKFDFNNIYRCVGEILDPRPIWIAFFMPIFDTLVRAKYELPIKYKYYAIIRPEIPTRTEAEEFVRYGVANIDEFKKVMAMRGFADKYINAYIKTITKVFSESDMAFLLGRASRATPAGEVQIEDWAKKAAEWMLRAHGYLPDTAPDVVKEAYSKFLEYKIYEMAVFPSVRDIISFAVKEVFENLELQYDAVKNSAPAAYLKFAEMKGLNEYWALAYWDEHWRLVPPEKIADLWFRAEITTTEFDTYLRYHDYRPVARPGFSMSDIEMMRRALYEIPLRIDVRWMMRWGIGTLEDLARIVCMRGMHPEWRGKIIAAEWVNNLQEERTRYVSSLMKAMEEGIISFDDFKKAVSEYTMKTLKPRVRVKGPGGEATTISIPLKIKLLNDDEIELNARRILVEIRRTYVKNKLAEIEYLYVSGQMSDKELEESIRKLLKVEDVVRSTITKIKARKIRDQLYYTHRQILRTVDALCSLYEEGFLTKQEVIQHIRTVAGRWLTEDQIKVIIAESDVRIARSKARYFVKAVLNRLKRGAITVSEAIQELSKIIKDTELVKAIVEAEARIYTMSLERLISMYEYVPIPPRLFMKKVEALGVPEDEAKLLPAYIVARELDEELKAYVRELGKMYVEGMITKQEFERELNNVASLWGKARELGVDWVLFSPDERKLIIARYDAEKKIKEMKRR